MCTIHTKGSHSQAASLPVSKGQPRAPRVTPSAPCLTQIGAGPTTLETEVICGCLSTAALLCTPYTDSHSALILWQGHHGEENSLFLLRVSTHPGDDPAADISVSKFLAARGSEAFAPGNISQLP